LVSARGVCVLDVEVLVRVCELDDASGWDRSMSACVIGGWLPVFRVAYEVIIVL